MPNNYVLLERIELNDSAASVTFANIPQTGYTDLKIVGSARSTRSANGDDIRINFNGSNSNFSGRRILGTGSSVISTTMTSQIGIWDAASDTASTYGNFEVYIPNYNQAIPHPYSADTVNENNATAAYAQLTAGLWSPATAQAITSITFLSDNGFNLVAGSTFSLYGIANSSTTPAIAPKADGGNVIATDGTYWYHAFLSNGTFTPQTNLTCDVLQVAGGGGGGGVMGGGGGAGGVSHLASQSLTISSYSVTVGAGGNAGVGQTGRGTNGTNSQFGSLTAAIGGGGGGAQANPLGLDGGSGGGRIGSGTVASGTSGQGNNGGYGADSGAYGTGGGGGAGAVGANGTTSAGGAGGSGTSLYSSWGAATNTGQYVSTIYYYAGGGGGSQNGQGTGGPGGNGGGGAGASGTDGTPGAAATINTGGGGGGAAGDTPISATGGGGGSGIVIVRYLVAS